VRTVGLRQSRWIKKFTATATGVLPWMIARSKCLQRRKPLVREEDVEIVSQRQKPDVGRYLLQVDRQTKGSFHTSEDAQSAALEIKKAFPVLQVSIYDRVTSSHTLVKVS
jgi:hypothetical protein